MARDEIIGSRHKNLVFKTAGSIRVLIGDKYYNLAFEDENSKNTEEENQDSESSNGSFTVVNSISGQEFSSDDDGKIIFTLDGGIYYIKGGKPIKYNFQNDVKITSFDSTISFNGSPAFNIKDGGIIRNLNSQYLNGFSASDFIRSGISETVFRNITVDSFTTSDGEVSYLDGVFTYPKSNIGLTHIGNKVTIGYGIVSSGVEELPYSKYLPFENTLYTDLLEAINEEGLDVDLENLLVPVNVNTEAGKRNVFNANLPDDQEEIAEVILFDVKESNIWDTSWVDDNYNERSLRDIYNSVIKDIPNNYNKAAYIIDVDTVLGLNIGDTFTAKIYRDKFLINGEKTYNECNSDEDDGIDIIDVNCIITKIDSKNNKISISTDYESNLYKCSIKRDSVLTVEINGENHNIQYYNYIIDESSEYECLSDDSDLRINIEDADSVIGDLSGETFNGKELSGYGLLMSSNCYLDNSELTNSKYIGGTIENAELKNCKIEEEINEFEEINLSSGDHEIEIKRSITNYVISGVEYVAGTDETEEILSTNILLPEGINGYTINIYSLNNIRCNNSDIYAQTYNTYICMPISGQLT